MKPKKPIKPKIKPADVPTPKHVLDRPNADKIKRKTRASRYIWRQRKEWGESIKTYQMFLAYRDMPAQSRSFRAAAKLIGVSEVATKVNAQRYKWRHRAEAYYQHLAIKAEKAKERAIEKLVEEEVRLGAGMMKQSLKRVRKIRPITVKDLTSLAKTGSDLRRRGLGLPKEPDVKVENQTNVQVNVVDGLLKKLEQFDEDAKNGGLTIVK